MQTLATAPAVWPAYDEATAYLPLKTGALVAANVTDGAIRWTVDNVKTDWTPAVDGGRLYLAGDGAVEARDAATGQTVWRVPTQGTVSAQPVARAGWLIVAVDNGEVLALRGDSGEGVWKLTLNGVVKTAPLIVGDRLYLAPEASPLMAIELLTGKTLWERDLGGTVNSVSAHGDRICVGTASRMFFGLEEKRGRVEWKWRIGGDVIGRPAFDDETVYVLNMDNTLRAFALRDGGQRWREALEFRPLAGLVRIEGTLLVASFTPMLRGYSTKDGKQKGRFSLPIGESSAPAAPPQFFARPSFVDDVIVTTALDGRWIGVRRVTSPPIVPLTDLPGIARPLLAPDGSPAPPSPPSAPAATPPLASPPAAAPAPAAVPAAPVPATPPAGRGAAAPSP